MMYLSVKLSPWISMFIGIIAACLFALVIGAPCFRLRGVFFSIATISCTTILRQCLIVFKMLPAGLSASILESGKLQSLDAHLQVQN